MMDGEMIGVATILLVQAKQGQRQRRRLQKLTTMAGVMLIGNFSRIGCPFVPMALSLLLSTELGISVAYFKYIKTQISRKPIHNHTQNKEIVWNARIYSKN